MVSSAVALTAVLGLVALTNRVILLFSMLCKPVVGRTAISDDKTHAHNGVCPHQAVARMHRLCACGNVTRARILACIGQLGRGAWSHGGRAGGQALLKI